mmetsp:Transcript_4176/g.6575  ORF Transcript_4176/g.6575 Transcript_4176/m.6575 type:complete len:120 (+) Transcript_4176:1022-1381(+)
MSLQEIKHNEDQLLLVVDSMAFNALSGPHLQNRFQTRIGNRKIILMHETLLTSSILQNHILMGSRTFNRSFDQLLKSTQKSSISPPKTQYSPYDTWPRRNLPIHQSAMPLVEDTSQNMS